MSIGPGGLYCDICGDYFLKEVLLGSTVQCFRCDGIDRELHCHDRCREAAEAAGKDWTKLPAGPLRNAFQRAADAANEQSAEDGQ